MSLLQALIGCKNVEHILLFLLVNEKCYAHQIHRRLGVALTPIQKALSRLETGKIITSIKEGKKRFFFFNDDYPVLQELEALLKKTYHKLPVKEKQLYHFCCDRITDNQNTSHKLLETIWKQLETISSMTLIASSCSKEPNAWKRKGKGDVEVIHEDHRIIFNEKGSWDSGVNFSNSYRWTWSFREETLSLEHLRHGNKHPVFLFFLKSTDHKTLESQTPHLCGEDTYFGWMQHNPLFMQMNIRTIGPKKNEKIECIYT